MTSPILAKWMQSGDPSQDDAGVEPSAAPFEDQESQLIVPRTMRNFAYEIAQQILLKVAPYALVPIGTFATAADLPTDALPGSIATVTDPPPPHYWGYDGLTWNDMGPVPSLTATVGITGAVPTVGDLPPDASQGDAYIVEADGHLYVYDGTTWVDAGSVVGPAGPEGPPGPAGLRMVASTQLDDDALFLVDVGPVEQVADVGQLQADLIAGQTYRCSNGGSLIGTVSNENFLINLLAWPGLTRPVNVGDLATATTVLTQRVRTALTPGNSFYASSLFVAPASGPCRLALSMVRSAGVGVANVIGGSSAPAGPGFSPTRYPIISTVEEVAP